MGPDPEGSRLREISARRRNGRSSDTRSFVELLSHSPWNAPSGRVLFFKDQPSARSVSYRIAVGR